MYFQAKIHTKQVSCPFYEIYVLYYYILYIMKYCFMVSFYVSFYLSIYISIYIFFLLALPQLSIYIYLFFFLFIYLEISFCGVSLIYFSYFDMQSISITDLFFVTKCPPTYFLFSSTPSLPL